MKVRHSAENWDGSYGYGAGKAHPCVEHVQCPVCGAPKGKLCMGSRGFVKFDRHYKRAELYQRKLARERSDGDRVHEFAIRKGRRR